MRFDRKSWGKNMMGKCLSILRLKYLIDCDDCCIYDYQDLNDCLAEFGLPQFDLS